MSLLEDGATGDVMAVWNDCPAPYLVPESNFALFILFTTCAMFMRFVPTAVFDSRNVVLKPFPHYLVILSLIVLMNLAVGSIMSSLIFWVDS